MLYLNDPSDVDGFWLGNPWDRNLKGPIYKNVATDTDCELFPADSTAYGPAKFAEAFENAYGPNRPGGGGVAILTTIRTGMITPFRRLDGER